MGKKKKRDKTLWVIKLTRLKNRNAKGGRRGLNFPFLAKDILIWLSIRLCRTVWKKERMNALTMVHWARIFVLDIRFSLIV